MADKAVVATNFRQQAETYMNENSPGKSFTYYLLSLQFMPQWKNELRNPIVLVLCHLGKILEHEERYSDLFTSYEQALKIFPDDEVILNNLGAHLCRLQHFREAVIYFKKALRVNKNYLPAYRNLEIAKSHLVLGWHFRMLNDSWRNESYERTITKKIDNNFKTILDIGTGTGLLSIYAKKAGATIVYSCDYSTTMISIAEKVLSANFLTDSIVLINKLSNNLSIPGDIPQRLSLAVTETFDGGLLGEHILQTLIHAWENLLEPRINEEGQLLHRVIPYSAILFITPIKSLQLARKLYVLKSNRIKRKSFVEGLNLSVLQYYALSTEPYDTENLKKLSFNSLGPTRRLFEFDFNNVTDLKEFYNGDRDTHFKIKLSELGFLDALAVWFELMLDSETSITSSPFSINNCCWDQAVFPMKKECFVKKKSSISVFASCLNGVLSITTKSDKNSENSKLEIAQPVIRLLNCETLLLKYVQVLNYIKTIYNDNKNISVLDLSWFPYKGILIAKDFNAVVYASSQHFEVLPSLKELFTCNKVDEKKVHFKKWSDMLEMLEHKSKKFDVIMVDFLTTAGQINEEVIELIPLLKNQLHINGLFLPLKLTIYCQVIFSEELANSSRMNVDKDKLNISKFINEYKVSNIEDLKLKEFDYEEMSAEIAIAVLDMNIIVNNKLVFEREIDILKSGSINAIIYWFSINYISDIEFFTISPDSHVNQGATLLDNQVSIEGNLKLKLVLHYDSGAMKFVVL